MEINHLLDYAILFFLQYIPNGLIYILAGYAFSKNVIDGKKYLLSSLILSTIGFMAKILSEIKLLNTSNTVPQILILFASIFLLVNINKIKMVKAIISSLIIMILQLFIEVIYVVIVLKSIIGVNLDKIFNKSMIMISLIGLPYLIILGIIVLLFYKCRIKSRIQ